MTSQKATSICFISPGAYCYFNPESTPIAGGAERQLYLLSQELKSEFDLHFVVGDYGQPKRERRDGVTLHRAYEPKSVNGIHDQVRKAMSLLSAMRRADTDVYVTRGQTERAPVDYLWTRVLGKEWIFNIVNNPWAHARENSTFRYRLLRHGFENARNLIAQTAYQADLYEEYFGLDPTVVPNGYPSGGRPHPYDARDYFVWVGRINEGQKRPDLYLDLAADLPDYEFRLIGPYDDDEAYGQRIEQRAADLDNVEYLGPVDPSEIYQYFERAIALVNTSQSEGFPNTFLEAWRFGTPTISLDVELSRFLPPDADECYAAGDHERLVELAEKLAADTGTREKVGTEVFDYFERQYTIERVAEQYAAALRSV